MLNSFHWLNRFMVWWSCMASEDSREDVKKYTLQRLSKFKTKGTQTRHCGYIEFSEASYDINIKMESEPIKSVISIWSTIQEKKTEGNESIKFPSRQYNCSSKCPVKMAIFITSSCIILSIKKYYWCASMVFNLKHGNQNQHIPRAKSTIPAATATAEPLDDPPGICDGTSGLAGHP